ncbi:Phosphoenolpyruvate carboxylase 1, partial [Tetrabaena socialis]
MSSFRLSNDLRGNPHQFLTGLRDDDSLLRQVFFSILRHHHPNLAAKPAYSIGADLFNLQPGSLAPGSLWCGEVVLFGESNRHFMVPWVPSGSVMRPRRPYLVDSCGREAEEGRARQGHLRCERELAAREAMNQPGAPGLRGASNVKSDADFELLVKYLTDLKPEERILVASSFSHMLNLHNLTEEVNSSQIGRAVRLGEVEGLMFDLSIWRCSAEMKELAERIASAENREAARVAEERKKRNYADFWAPIPPTEPFRVVLSHMRDRLYNTRQ